MIVAKNLSCLGTIEHPQINNGEPTPFYKLTEPTAEEWNRRAREANKQAIRNGMTEPPPALIEWFTWAGRDGVAYWAALQKEVQMENAR